MRFERGGERRKAHDLAGLGRTSCFEKVLPGAGMPANLGGIARPVGGDARAHHEALLRQRDRRLQQALDAPGAVVLEQAHPAADGAGHRHGVSAVRLDARQARLGEPRRGGGLRRPTGGVERDRLPWRPAWQSARSSRRRCPSCAARPRRARRRWRWRHRRRCRPGAAPRCRRGSLRGGRWRTSPGGHRRASGRGSGSCACKSPRCPGSGGAWAPKTYGTIAAQRKMGRWRATSAGRPRRRHYRSPRLTLRLRRRHRWTRRRGRRAGRGS